MCVFKGELALHVLMLLSFAAHRLSLGSLLLHSELYFSFVSPGMYFVC